MRKKTWWVLDVDEGEFCGVFLSMKSAARVAGLRHSVPENAVFESLNKKWLIFPVPDRKKNTPFRVTVKPSEMWKFNYEKNRIGEKS